MTAPALPETVPQPSDTCARCGCTWSWHTHRDGTPRQGWQASRFTGANYCGNHKLSGGAAGMLQWCGCQGWAPREASA